MKAVRLIPLLAILIGCGAPQPVQGPKQGPDFSIPTGTAEERIREEDLEVVTRIGLMGPNGKLTVGAREAAVEDLFPRPQGTTLISEAPESIPSNIRARGWIGNNEGFGTLLTNDAKGDARVVSAMLQRTAVTREVLDQIVTTYQTELGTPHNRIDGRRVSYWFWEEPPHRLVIVAVRVENGYNVTVAMGEDRVMTRQRMDYDIAQRDSALAEEEFLRKEQESSPVPARNG